MKKIQVLAFLLFFLLLPFIGYSAVLHVPSAYNTIQEAINASADGDMVLVEPGTYIENLNLLGKNITLCSRYFTTGNAAFIASTIIDGGNNDRVITINNGETASCELAGFTIQHGNVPDLNYNEYGGGGILILDSSPKILNCIIQNNYAAGFGGGLAISGTSSACKVINCTIKNNTADSFGGGVMMGNCSTDAEIISCIIAGNTNTNSNTFNGGGGGVNLYHAGKLTDCLITGNSAPNSSVGGGGVNCDWADLSGSQSIFVTGCTIANNTALNYGGVSQVITGGEFRNCIIWGNTDQYNNVSNYDGNTFINCCTDPMPGGTGNIVSDPAFINPVSGNFRLNVGSPCIDAGDSSFNTQTTDLDGNSRIFGNSIDIGAYESCSVQIGSGTDTYDFFPVYSCYNYNYSQQIYLGSEISTGGGAF